MSVYDGVEPTVYEITWNSGHVEKLAAHQVTWPNNSLGALAMFATKTTSPERVRFHAEINGLWTLMLDAQVDDIRTIRNTATEETTHA
jgi:hypothetical protein